MPTPALRLLANLAVLALFVAMVVLSARALGRLARGQPVFPPQEPTHEPRTLGDVLTAVAVWFLLNFLIPMVYVPLSGRPRGQALEPIEQMLLISFVNLAALVVIPWQLERQTGGRFRRAYLNGQGALVRVGQGVRTCLMMLPAVYLVNLPLVLLTKPRAHPLAKMVEADLSPVVAVLAVVSGGLLAPAAEELIFRGVLLSWIAGLRRSNPRPPACDAPETLDHVELPPDLPGNHPAGAPDVSEASEPNSFEAPRAEVLGADEAETETAVVEAGRPHPWLRANLITSLLFGLVHAQQWPAPIPIFILSLGLGHLYARTGSLVAAFAMHATFNSVSTLFLFLARLVQAPPT